MKTIFLSLLALQPAVNAVEALALNARWFPTRPSTKRVGTLDSIKIISDCSWHHTSAGLVDLHDVTGHHRYYGRSSYA